MDAEVWKSRSYGKAKRKFAWDREDVRPWTRFGPHRKAQTGPGAQLSHQTIRQSSRHKNHTDNGQRPQLQECARYKKVVEGSPALDGEFEYDVACQNGDDLL